MDYEQENCQECDSSKSIMSIGEKRLACQEKISGIKNIDLDKFLLHDTFHVRDHQSCI
jgi:hypothetical protein